MLSKIAIILLVLSSSLFSQVNLDSLDWIIVDSLIYESKQKTLPYPFEVQIDSARKEFSKVAKKYYDEGAFCVHPLTEKPLFFGVNSGEVVSFQDYLNESKKNFPDSCILLFELDIDWMGNISRAKLVRYKGEVNLKWDIDYFLSNIKAIPAKYSGIPQNYRMMLPIRKR